MLKPRIIPCLLIHNKGLVKTQRFKDAKYVGDPLNAVRIFNEKEVDELMIIDIDATVNGKEPNFDLIKNLAFECRMPLCYGGGVTTVEHARRIISLGAEKVAMSSSAIQTPVLVQNISKAIGSQSVVIVLDVKKKKLFGGYDLYINNGKNSTGKNPIEFAKKMEKLGAGEIVINSIDNDGMMKGFDFKIIDAIRNAINLPMTVLGGAGSLDDLHSVVDKYGVIGAAAGSLFVFKGKYRAVLISYPSELEKRNIIKGLKPTF